MPMYPVVDKFKHGLMKKAAKVETVQTDTAVFRLFYKLSILLVGIYAIAHVYVTFNTTVISCLPSKPKEGLFKDKDIKKVETFCWVHGTYSVRNSAFASGRQIYPGLGGITNSNDTLTYQYYYKWTYIVVLLMGMSLYAPRYIWRNIENGRMKRLVGKLSNVVLVDGEVEKEQERLSEYFFIQLGQHRNYALGLPICEALNLVVASVLLLLLNYATGYELGMGNATPSLDENFFPILGKCTFEMFGNTGNIEIHDFICILPFNIVNEFAAVFFWYYFWFLVIAGTLQLAYRIVLIFSKRARYHVLRNLIPLSNPIDVSFVVDNIKYYDWFVFTQAGINLEPNILRHVWLKFVFKLRLKEERNQLAERRGTGKPANPPRPPPPSIASTPPISPRATAASHSAPPSCPRSPRYIAPLHSSRQDQSRTSSFSPSARPS